MAYTRLTEIQDRIATAASAAGRDAAGIELVVVTKYASDDEVEAVIADGARSLGESRSDGLRLRADRHPERRWHFVGRLQRNKAAAVRRHADLLHSMDRAALAERWAGAEGPPPPVLVQVDVAGEPQKGGVTADDAPMLVEQCRQSGLDVVGLMTIPPRPELPSDSQRWFAALREMRDRIARDHPEVEHLSMGMSDDFEIAVAEGATILRVGRAIFAPFDDEG